MKRYSLLWIRALDSSATNSGRIGFANGPSHPKEDFGAFCEIISIKPKNRTSARSQLIYDLAVKTGNESQSLTHSCRFVSWEIANAHASRPTAGTGTIVTKSSQKAAC
jgi:hypothetical protein